MDSFITNLKRRMCLMAVLAFLAFAPSAIACPVCSSNRADQPPRSSQAMLGTTAAMMALPFGMLAGFVWWLRKNL